MRCKLCILVFLVALCVNVFAQTASDLYFYQDGTTIVLTYSLDQMANVSVQVSTDGGVRYSAPLQHVSGDVGENVQAGNNRIVWDVLAEYDKFVGDKVMFRLTAEGGKRSFTVKGVTFNMVQVQGGTFTMGATSEQGSEAESNEKPTHSVTLSDYYIGETEVTQALWEAVMGNNPSNFKGANHPVEGVRWNECRDFIRKLNALTGATFRLPKEAEWEYAARGGNKSKGYKYSGSNYPDDVAWYSNNSGDSTHVVATKQANELGIYDMSGNVSEWCSDRHDSYSSLAQTNPIGASSGSVRVLRGGSLRKDAGDCRVSSRSNATPDSRFYDMGLRLVLVP